MADTGTITYGESPKDAQGRRFVIWPDGSKYYLLPDAGSQLWYQGSTGGMIHKPDNWNPKTGQWEKGGVDWGKLGPWLGLAAIGGASAAAALSSSAPAAIASANTAASTTGAGTAGGTLAATSTVPTATGLTAGGTASGAVPGALSSVSGGVSAGTGGTVAAVTRIPGGIGGGIGGGVPGATGATGGIMGKLGSLGWANLIGAGAQLGGSYLQSRAVGKAAELEAKGNKEALDFTKQVYEQERNDLAPYRALGANSLNTLSAIMGQPSQYPATMGRPAMPPDPNRIQPGTPFPSSIIPGSPMASQSGGQLVPMIGPDGSRGAVPADQVAHWINLKARVDTGAQQSPMAATNTSGRSLADAMRTT